MPTWALRAAYGQSRPTCGSLARVSAIRHRGETVAASGSPGMAARGFGGGRGGDQWTAARGNGPSLPTWHGEVRRCKVSAGGGEAAGE